MTAKDIVAKLRALGQPSYQATLQKHGIVNPCFGVTIEELKKFQKQIKKDYQLALDLFVTGIHDCQYLAGLIADESKMTKKNLQDWAKQASSPMVREYPVAWVAAESAHGWELAQRWIDSKNDAIATVGWATLSHLVCMRADEDLELPKLKEILQRVHREIHGAPNRVRYVMNGFVIAVGSYVHPLADTALQIGTQIGKVHVEMGGTACKVPHAPDYIRKCHAHGTLKKKKRTVRC